MSLPRDTSTFSRVYIFLDQGLVMSCPIDMFTVELLFFITLLLSRSFVKMTTGVNPRQGGKGKIGNLFAGNNAENAAGYSRQKKETNRPQWVRIHSADERNIE